MQTADDLVRVRVVAARSRDVEAGAVVYYGPGLPLWKVWKADRSEATMTTFTLRPLDARGYEALMAWQERRIVELPVGELL